MKIAFITDVFPKYSQTFIARKAEYLLSEGHDIHVFCNYYDHNVPLSSSWRRRIHVFPSRQQFPRFAFVLLVTLIQGLFSRRLRKSLKEAQKIQEKPFPGNVRSLACAQMIANEKWDVIHVHFLTNVGCLLRFPGLIKHPVICSVLGFDASIAPYREEGGLQNFQRRIEVADGLIYSSKFLQRLVHAETSITVPEKILFPEVDASLFRSKTRTQPHSPCRILSVGRLDWMKGYPFALTTIRKLLDDGIACEYRIIGEGNARTEIEYLIREMDLGDHVFLLGTQMPEEVASNMNWADIYLGLSSKEEFGATFAEAGVSGLPVVASRVGGIPESTSENETAFLVSRADWRAAADAIQILIEKPGLYKQFSEAGPKLAKKFDNRVVGQELVEFYAEVIRDYQKNVLE